MGCGAVTKPEKSLWLNAFSGMFRYRVKVLVTNGSKANFEFVHEDQFDEMPLTTLMNIIAFNEKDAAQFDANFISVYDKLTDSFTYKIQRLLGYESNEAGLEWWVMVNKVKHSWDDICKSNLRVRPQDNLVCVLQGNTMN
jgi:hypothetical protein